MGFQSWPRWFRWTMIVPAFLLGGTVGQLLPVLGSLFTPDSMPKWWVQVVGSAFIPAFSLYAVWSIAPSHKFGAVLCAGAAWFIFLGVSVGMVAYGSLIGFKFSEPLWWYYICAVVFVCSTGGMVFHYHKETKMRREEEAEFGC